MNSATAILMVPTSPSDIRKRVVKKILDLGKPSGEQDELVEEVDEPLGSEEDEEEDCTGTSSKGHNSGKSEPSNHVVDSPAKKPKAHTKKPIHKRASAATNTRAYVLKTRGRAN